MVRPAAQSASAGLPPRRSKQPPLLSLRPRVCHSKTRVDVRLLGPCFKTGRSKLSRQHPWRGDPRRTPWQKPMRGTVSEKTSRTPSPARASAPSLVPTKQDKRRTWRSASVPGTVVEAGAVTGHGQSPILTFPGPFSCTGQTRTDVDLSWAQSTRAAARAGSRARCHPLVPAAARPPAR